MRTAAQERQDHDTLLPPAAAFAIAFAVGTLTAALPLRSVEAQAAPPCTAIQDDAERLACYDRALRAASQAPSTPTPAAAPAPAAQAPAGQTPAAQSVPAATPSASSPAPAGSERRIRDSAAPVAPAAPVAGGTADDDDGDLIIPIVIIGTRGYPGREMYFTAQDGTTWVQTDSQRVVGLPEPPFEADIKPGAMGSQFLVPKDRGRAIRVRAAEH